MKKYLLIILLIGFCFGQNSTILYISTNGSDEIGDGSEENPFATIQKGIDFSNGGDTILVAPGHFYENINWSTASSIKLIGSGADSTIIDGGGNGTVIDNSDDTSYPIEISNLTIKNGYSTGKGGGISLKMVGDLLLKNLIIADNSASRGGGVYIEGQGSVSFLKTMVYFENVIIYNNSADAYGGGIYLGGDFTSSIIKNTTVVNNLSVDGGGGLAAGSMGDFALIVNSIFWNNQPSNGTGFIFPYYSNIDIPMGDNNIYVNPLFEDGINNFNLLDNSPCVDSGTDFLTVDLSYHMLSADLPDTILHMAEELYNGFAPDMGAIESSHSASIYSQKVFVEDFTADQWCPYCGVGSLTMNDLLEDNSDNLISIQWQAGSDSFNPDDCQYDSFANCKETRGELYDIWGIPTEVFNGTGLVVGADVINDNYAIYDSAYQSLVHNTTNYDITIEGSKNGSTIYYSIDVIDDDTSSMDHYVHTFIVEDSILTTWNYQSYGDSLDFARNVVRHWFTDSLDGSEIAPVQNFTGYFEMDSNLWDTDYIKIVAIIQNKTTNDVYQANQIKVNTFEFLETSDSVPSKSSIIPVDYALHQNYPNPFNPVTLLRYDLPEYEIVNIAIYDMKGRIVKTLVNGPQPAGNRSIQWNATNDNNEPVSAGVYLCTIQAGTFNQTKKMILLK